MRGPLRRRQFLAGVGASAGVAVAGCTDSTDGDPSGTPNAEPSDEPTETPAPEPVLEGALFFAFAPDRVAAVDPDSGDVSAAIDDGIDGASWGDVLQVANGDVYACDGARAQAVVVDPETMRVRDRVDVGPDPVHAFQPRAGEVWVHSDADGAFYVVDTESLSVEGTVRSGLEEGGHGKLVTHEELGERAYGTNVTSAAATTIDVGAREQTGHIELCDDAGTHYGAYSPWNGHAYLECTDGRLAIVDTDSDEVIEHREYGGGLYVGEGILGVVDENTVQFLDATTEDDERFAVVELEEGGPDSLEFHAVDGTTYAFAANTATPDVVVVDVDDERVVDRIDAGDIERPEDAHHLHRTATMGGGYYATPADADGVLAVIDATARRRAHLVEIAEGVDTVAFVEV